MPKAQGYLWEKIACFSALRRSALEAAKGKRESEEVAAFLLRLETECLQLKAELEAGTYRPGSYRLFAIYEPKQWIICAAPFRDRVVHHALCAALEPRLEAFAIYDTYACRDGKGTHKAVKRAQAFSHQSQFFLKLDVVADLALPPAPFACPCKALPNEAPPPLEILHPGGPLRRGLPCEPTEPLWTHDAWTNRWLSV